MTPIRLLKKQINKNKIFPNEVARLYAEKKYSPKKISLEINTFFKKDVLTPEEVTNILIDVKKQDKLAEKSTVSLQQKQFYAITSIVASTIVTSISKDNKNKQAKWLPSSSSNPSLAHMENYGEVFNLDEGINGELPGERPNCQCGFTILNND